MYSHNIEEKCQTLCTIPFHTISLATTAKVLDSVPTPSNVHLLYLLNTKLFIFIYPKSCITLVAPLLVTIAALPITFHLVNCYAASHLLPLGSLLSLHPSVDINRRNSYIPTLLRLYYTYDDHMPTRRAYITMCLAPTMLLGSPESTNRVAAYISIALNLYRPGIFCPFHTITGALPSRDD